MNNKKTTKINGLYVIEGFLFNDHRGKLIKPISFDNQGLNFNTKETWFTVSKKNVIRGMHMQIDPFPSNKLVSIIQGEVLDVVLDCRIDSQTYGLYDEFKLSDRDNKLLYIPAGCAHGYKVIVDNSIVMYMSDENHHNDSDLGYHYDSFNYNWEIDNPIISDKDSKLQRFLID